MIVSWHQHLWCHYLVLYDIKMVVAYMLIDYYITKFYDNTMVVFAIKIDCYWTTVGLWHHNDSYLFLKCIFFFFCSSELKWQRNRDLQSIGLLTKWWYGWSFRISQKPWTFFSDSHLMTQQLGPSFATLPIIKDLLQKWSSQDLNCCS